MIRRIVLENYMSHASTVIEPAEGLTVLVGPNNCGKSAVVSALLTVCGENDGGFMVRHGEKLARVTVETAEGDTIIWQRKRGTPSYVINGREVHRVGRGNLPDDLQTLLKLPVIEFGEGSSRNRFVVHFGLQKEPIFLINSEADVAKFFASSAESERLMGMQRLHKRKAQDARGAQKLVEADLQAVTAQLDALTPLDAIGPELDAIEAEHRAWVATIAEIEELAARIRRVEAAGSQVTRERARAESIDPLRPPPALQDPAPLDQLIERIARCSRETDELGARGNALHGLHDPPATADERGLEQACARMTAFSRAIEAGQARVDAARVLGEPPAPADPTPLVDLGKALAKATAAVERLTADVGALAKLADPPALVDPAPVAQAVDRLDRAAAHVGACEKNGANVSAKLDAVREEIVAWVTDNPLCPVCGGAVQGERVLETGGPLAG